MWKLWPIFLFSMLMAWLSDMNSPYKYGRFGEKVYVYKEKLFYSLMTISMAVFAGLRITYNDTETYRQMYENTKDAAIAFKEMKWSIGANPGFNAINIWLHKLGVSTQSYIMLYALVTVCIYMWFIRKYSDDILFTVFLFYTMGCYTFAFAAIKQCVAVAFCLIATDRAIRKKWIPFVLWVLLAMTFHPYSFMYLVIPLLMFNPWTKRSYTVLLGLGFAAAGVSLQFLLGRLISITSMMGEEYTTTSFTGDGVNIFRLGVVWIPVILSFFTQNYWRENNERESSVIMNLAMVNAEIMFIARFGTANYFARLANYFLIFQSLALPILLRYFNRASREILKAGAFVGFMLYFIYSNWIMYGGFDFMFRRVGFFEYLVSLF